MKHCQTEHTLSDREQQLEQSLQQLPELTDRWLGGLEATPGLHYRILSEASGKKQRRAGFLKFPGLAAAAGAVLAAVVLAVVLPMTGRDAAVPSDPQETPVIVSRSAGSADDTAVLTAAGGLYGGEVTGGSTRYQSLWENGVSGSFPMVVIRGSCYRMLTEPSAVPSSVLGSVIATVEEVTEEPSLSGSGVVMSNVTSLGAEIREVSGMSGTLVAAQVNGTMRLFQRVSFNGRALSAGEGLADTLQISGHVTAMTLDGAGTVTDASTISSLVNTLLNASAYESAAQVTADSLLTISLDNGLTVQLAVKGDRFSACGTWSNPDFFDAFAAAVN